MTRKDYELIAASLNTVYNALAAHRKKTMRSSVAVKAQQNIVLSVMYQLIDQLRHDPRFNQEKFIAAVKAPAKGQAEINCRCGLEPAEYCPYHKVTRVSAAAEHDAVWGTGNSNQSCDE